MRIHLVSMLLLWVGSLGGAVFAFSTQLLLAHSLTVAEMGVIAGVMSLMLLANPLAEFGVSGVWLRVFGRSGISAFSWVKPSLFLVVLASVVVTLGMPVIGFAVWEEPQVRHVLAWLIVLPPMEAAVVLVGSRMQLEGRFRVLSLWRALPKFGRLLVAIGAWLAGFDLMAIAIGYGVSSLFIMVLAIIQILPMVKGNVMLEKLREPRGAAVVPTCQGEATPTVKEVFSHAWPFAMANVFSLIYLQSDIFMLSAINGSESTGLYSVAFSMIALVYLLPTAIFHQFLLPRYHRWAEHEPDRLLKAYQLGNGYMIVVGLLVMVLLACSAPYLVELLFGAKYAKSGDVVQVLALCVPFRYLASSIGSCLVTKHHMRRKTGYQMVVAVFNVVLNLGLIPHYGMYGAAIATVASEMLLCALYLFGATKHVFGAAAVRGWTLNYKRANR